MWKNIVIILIILIVIWYFYTKIEENFAGTPSVHCKQVKGQFLLMDKHNQKLTCATANNHKDGSYCKAFIDVNNCTNFKNNQSNFPTTINDCARNANISAYESATNKEFTFTCNDLQ